jgi:periplasmic protein TonB
VTLTGVTYDDSGMAFQALLFCPDDKTARTVTQVLSELEFSVEPCTEPFAAVKKLMGGHFDALVVDCDNEQNATLLFKSARNSTSNQTSLAVAIVEGQAGVAKAFRIGANLVLTKPINVEQSKGTLRVARGLLRKGEPVKPGAPAPAPVAAAPAAIPTKPAPARPAAPAVSAKPAPSAAKPASAPGAQVVAAQRAIPPVPAKPVNVASAQVAASSGLADADETLAVKGTAPAITLATSVPAASRPALSTSARPVANKPFANKPVPPIAPAKSPMAPSAIGFGSGAASAPAPALEAPVAEVTAASTAPTSSVLEKIEELEHRAAPASALPETFSETAAESSSQTAPAPTFTFGGANAPEESDGGRKKIFLGIAAVVLVAVSGYVAYAHFSGGASQPASHVPAAAPAPSAATTASPQPAKPTASASVPVPPPAAQPEQANSQPATTPADSSAAADDSTADSGNASTSNTASKPGHAASPVSKTAAPSAVAAKPAPAPLVVKGGAVPTAKAEAPAADTAAPNVAMADPASSGALSGLVSSGANAPKPVLQQVNISQGVSQGLLIKRVQPVYPKTALLMKIEGVVELMATVSQSGDITAVKVLKGDPQLTKAASDAVKQWKYKPYLLNGEPVEITTQVTVNFKLPE